MGLDRSASALKIAEDYGVQRIVERANQLDTIAAASVYSHVLRAETISAWDAARFSFNPAFRLPETPELGFLAHQAFASSSLAKANFGSEDALKYALAGIADPWLRKGSAGASARAISDIIAMGRGIETLGAFDKSYSQSLRSALGDWRDDAPVDLSALDSLETRSEFYAERGLDQELTDFPSAAFHTGMRLANLDSGSGGASDAYADEAAIAANAFAILRHFEIQVRRFIDALMTAEFGDKWTKTQLPANCLTNWEFKRDAEVSSGAKARALIDYADFTEYVNIIERKDNWRRVFQPIFRRVEDVRESFNRLRPVRIAVMHARPLSQDDQLLLHLETKRVLSAFDGLAG